MNKPPAFQFYPSDFLSDENVTLMNNTEIGCYIKLLCFCWKQGSIPNDINKIAKLCNEPNDVMAQLWTAIEPCFKNGDVAGRLVNPRLVKERQKQLDFREERSMSGRKGAEIRWKKESNGSVMAQPIAKPMANNGSSSSSSSSEKRDKKFIPPSENEVIKYFLKNGYLASAGKKAFKYYDAAKWKDGKGNQVKNWKQKMIGVWFKDENKDSDNPAKPRTEKEIREELDRDK